MFSCSAISKLLFYNMTDSAFSAQLFESYCFPGEVFCLNLRPWAEQQKPREADRSKWDHPYKQQPSHSHSSDFRHSDSSLSIHPSTISHFFLPFFQRVLLICFRSNTLLFDAPPLHPGRKLTVVISEFCQIKLRKSLMRDFDSMSLPRKCEWITVKKAGEFGVTSLF